MEEWLQNQVAGNESTSDLESSDTGQKPNARAGKKMSSAAKFLKLDYIVDSLYSDSVIDPK